MKPIFSYGVAGASGSVVEIGLVGLNVSVGVSLGGSAVKVAVAEGGVVEVGVLEEVTVIVGLTVAELVGVIERVTDGTAVVELVIVSVAVRVIKGVWVNVAVVVGL